VCDTARQIIELTFDQPMSDTLSDGSGVEALSAAEGDWVANGVDSAAGNTIQLTAANIGAGTGAGTVSYDGSAGGLVGTSGVQAAAFAGFPCTFI
jgi:hypothetical protein